jgi:hypothetical protein
MKKTNFFGDFDYYAEINGNLYELENSYMFDRNVRRYKNTYCYIGIDFMHPDKNINPCIKMSFNDGSHLIKITLHHIRPFKGVTDVLLKDDNGNVIFINKLLPGEIFNYDVKIKKEGPFNLYLTIASEDITHSTVRTLIETTEIDFTGNLDITLNKSNWIVKEIDNHKLQDVKDIVYDTEYKY